ncbi:MAG: T9SS type A sorting domain-containing protein [Saprospiraceae bacterium]
MNKQMRFLYLLAFAAMHLPSGLSAADNPLFIFLENKKLDERQQFFARNYQAAPEVSQVWYFQTELKIFSESSFDINLPGRQSLICQQKYEKEPYGEHESWVGTIGNNEGTAFLVPNPATGLLTGTIYFGAKSYAIRSLTGGVHLLMEMDYSKSKNRCGVDGKETNIEFPIGRRLIPFDGNQDGFKTSEGSLRESENGDLLTGECRIRVLVAYTNQVAQIESDPLALILNAVDQTNDAYANSGLLHRIELARVYHTDFDDIGLEQGTVLNRWRADGDGFMDEVHTERIRWCTDLCALITNIGSGIASTTATYSNAFSCTNRTFVDNMTFQHELGHNYTCQHDPSDYGGNSIFRGYGQPDGVFRTIMAYPAACGAPDCPRVNEYSSPNNTYYHAPSNTFYITGTPTQNNVLGHVTTRETIVDYEVVPGSITYSGNYNISSYEAVHMAANSELGYSSATNQFDFHNRSQGSFRASDIVVLGQGFRALTGSSFRAYIHNCDPLNAADRNEAPAKAAISTFDGQQDQSTLRVMPNPFSTATTISYSLSEASNLSLQIFNATGTLIASPVQQQWQEPGSYQQTFEAKDLPDGIYLIVLQKDGVRTAKRVVLAR